MRSTTLILLCTIKHYGNEKGSPILLLLYLFVIYYVCIYNRVYLHTTLHVIHQPVFFDITNCTGKHIFSPPALAGRWSIREYGGSCVVRKIGSLTPQFERSKVRLLSIRADGWENPCFRSGPDGPRRTIIRTGSTFRNRFSVPNVWMSERLPCPVGPWREQTSGHNLIDSWTLALSPVFTFLIVFIACCN